MQTGTDCKHFGEYLAGPSGPGDERHFDCKSPVLLQRHGGPRICTTLTGCQSCDQFKPVVFPKWEWAVGITGFSSPNWSKDRFEARENYLVSLQQSLVQMFDGFPCTFYDGHESDTNLGPFGNFYIACTALYLRSPHATAYMICQDDIEIDPRVKNLVERWPVDGMPAVLSLYTATELIQKLSKALPTHWDDDPTKLPINPDIGDWRPLNEGHASPGACCYVFSQIGLLDFLTDPVVLWHKRNGPTQGWRDIDGVVGVWATKHGGIWHHVPPLVKHIGVVSSIDRGE